jgi:hypothetical protein
VRGKKRLGMTEALNAAQLSLLRRVAAAGYVRIVTADEKTTLDELVARKLIIGNQLTEAGWRTSEKAPGIARVVNPVRSVATDQRTPALQSSNRNDLTRQGRAGILAVPNAFDATHRSCT